MTRVSLEGDSTNACADREGQSLGRAIDSILNRLLLVVIRHVGVGALDVVLTLGIIHGQLDRLLEVGLSVCVKVDVDRLCLVDNLVLDRSRHVVAHIELEVFHCLACQ